MSRFHRLHKRVMPLLAATTLISDERNAKGPAARRRGNPFDPKSIQRMQRERMARNPPRPDVSRYFEPEVPVDLEKRTELHQRCKNVVDIYCHQHQIRGLALCVSMGGQQKLLYSTGIQDENLLVRTTPDLVGNISFLSRAFLIFILYKIADELNLEELEEEDPEDLPTIQDTVDFINPMPIANPLRPTDPMYYGATVQDERDPLFPIDTPDIKRMEYDMLAEERYIHDEFERFEVRYTDSAPQQMEEIRLDQLMHCKAGLKQHNTWALRNGRKKRFETLEDLVRFLIAHPLKYEPGTNYSGQYDMTSYELLAYLIEHRSGVSYQDVMKDELIKLGLNNTKFHEPNQLYLNKTRGSQNEDFNPAEEDPVYLNATPVDYSNKVGTEGLCSTVKDLDKFFNILFACITFDENRDPTEFSMPLDEFFADRIVQPYLHRAGDRAYYQLLNLTQSNLGNMRRHFAKGVMTEGQMGRRVRIYKKSLLFNLGEAMEGSSIAMVVAKVNEGMWRCTYFTDEETEVLRGLESKQFPPNLYDYHQKSDLLLRETNSKTEDTDSDLKQYTTVSIISTSRDKDLYTLARQLAKIVFDVYGME